MKFDEFQKKWNEENVEDDRFDWLTGDKIIYEMERKLLSYIPIKENYTVLEVGCGEGHNIVSLNKLYKNIKFYGVDISSSKIEFAKKHLKDVTLEVQDARKLDFTENTFDLVFCKDIVHHVKEDRENFVLEMVRVCKANGRVIIIESNGKNMLNVLHSIVDRKESELIKITPRYLKQMLNKKKLNYSMGFAEPHNFQRVLFHYKYGLNYLTKLKITGIILDLINMIPKPKSFYAYIIIDIQK